MSDAPGVPAKSVRIELAVGGPGHDAMRTVADAAEQFSAHAATVEGSNDFAQLSRLVVLGLLPSGRALASDLGAKEEARELPAVIAALLICLGFCGDAVRAERSGGGRDEAWKSAAAARYWLGVSVGIASSLTESAREHYKAWKNKQQAQGQWGAHAVAKSWARETYQKDKAEYRSKADFARTAQRHVKTHYGVEVEWPHIRDNWLKGL